MKVERYGFKLTDWAHQHQVFAAAFERYGGDFEQMVFWQLEVMLVLVETKLVFFPFINYALQLNYYSFVWQSQKELFLPPLKH